MKKAKVDSFSLKNGKTEIKLAYGELRKIVLILRAINHDLRKNIVKLLSETPKMNVTKIYIKLRLEQSVASQHLAILRRAGIVVTERQGKHIEYSLAQERLKEIGELAQTISIGE